MAGSCTTTNRQHCMFAHDGAIRAASKTLCSFSASTGLSENLRTLLLVCIASRVSIIAQFHSMTVWSEPVRGTRNYTRYLTQSM
ncbi:hypothetical protein [Oryzomonas rubra]|uniref:hypothetical protein n=1 Tax=Oryzomonas rubra TaxID=2509454 RepID=UPI001FE97FA8|nr:hypothetical protein [Oryzomonas rubra]